MKIAVAMSGGIDSSVAAALLKQEGHEVFGATMKLTDSSNNQNAIEDAQKVAEKLGIPHHVIDLRNIFSRVIITDFCREYSLGNTPNPCVLCNRYIKFGVLRERGRVGYSAASRRGAPHSTVARRMWSVNHIGSVRNSARPSGNTRAVARREDRQNICTLIGMPPVWQ